MVERDPSSELKDENARLIALLEANGIQWRVLPSAPTTRDVDRDRPAEQLREVLRNQTPGQVGGLSRGYATIMRTGRFG